MKHRNWRPVNTELINMGAWPSIALRESLATNASITVGKASTWMATQVPTQTRTRYPLRHYVLLTNWMRLSTSCTLLAHYQGHHITRQESLTDINNVAFRTETPDIKSHRLDTIVSISLTRNCNLEHHPPNQDRLLTEYHSSLRYHHPPRHPSMFLHQLNSKAEIEVHSRIYYKQPSGTKCGLIVISSW